MSISVVIPAYNCSETIRFTLNSVLEQTLQPTEIIVMDDGSTDDTLAILNSYEPSVIVLKQSNAGPSAARNALCQVATGQIIAFLDSDDIWHTRYLETLYRLFTQYPDVAAFFVGHINIEGNPEHGWSNAAVDLDAVPELIQPLPFFKRYNQKNGPFGSCSFCSIPRNFLAMMGNQPFQSDGAEDFYCAALFSLLGPVVYLSTPLVAYRVRADSHSSQRMRGLAARVQAFEMLEGYYERTADREFVTVFHSIFASHRRLYAKYLMGGRRRADARLQLRRSMRHARGPQSLAKSVGLLLTTYLPTVFQPRWPSEYRR